MSSKKASTTSLKERLQSAKNNENNIFDTINLAAQDDTGIRMIEIDKLIEAPSDWNFYSPLSDQKMVELIDSILSKGILNPIVVWERDNGKYMILSGHNRVQAFRYLEETAQNNLFKKIPALIKEKNEINEIEAREIIIDTNWVQRELSSLEKSRSILEKYSVLQTKAGYTSKYGKYGEGKTRDIIAEQYNISGRRIEEYKRLSNLIKEIQAMINDNHISATVAAKVALFDKDSQAWIYENFRYKLKSKNARKLNSKMNRNDISELFNNDFAKYEFKIKVDKKAGDKYNNLSDEQKNKLYKQVEMLILNF